MRILYIAYDGTEFDSQFDCEDYEETKRHQSLYDIDVYDKDGGIIHFTGFDNDWFYHKAERVVLRNDKEVEDILWLAEYTGWCEFEQLTSVGTWVRRQEGWNGVGIWEKVE